MAKNLKSSMMKLNEENYGDWSMMMEAVLVRKQLWDIVNGEKTRPMGSENSALVKSFIKKQAEARAELVLAVESSQLPHLRNSDPAKIWEEISMRHEDLHQGSHYVVNFCGSQSQKTSLCKIGLRLLDTWHFVSHKLELRFPTKILF